MLRLVSLSLNRHGRWKAAKVIVGRCVWGLEQRWMLFTSVLVKILCLGVVIGVTGCAVQVTGKQVSVVHPADKFFVAEWQAERHCDQFGLTAKHAQTSPMTSSASTLYFQTRTSVFECVEP